MYYLNVCICVWKHEKKKPLTTETVHDDAENADDDDDDELCRFSIFRREREKKGLKRDKVF